MPSAKTQQLLVASGNKKKLKELKELLTDLPFDVIGLDQFPNSTEVEENGKTFEANAILKAQGYARQTGLITIADDSGICCDALEGAPGIYSARFAGTGNDDDNNEKLLRLLEKVPDNCREAHFMCVVAICTPNKILGTFEGRVDGWISKKVKGDGGFGYDSVFYYPPFKKNFAEVPTEEKHKVSHRAKALAQAIDFLKTAKLP